MPGATRGNFFFPRYGVAHGCAQEPTPGSAVKFRGKSVRKNQASFIRAPLQWGGGLGGWVFSRVGGSKALDPPPLIILSVFWVGLLPHLLSLVTGALSGCLLVPLSVVSLCRSQVCRWQFFTWRTFFEASSQSDSQSRKQAGRKKSTVWVFSVADLVTSSGERQKCYFKQWSSGNAPDCSRVGRRFDSWSADRHNPVRAG